MGIKERHRKYLRRPNKIIIAHFYGKVLVKVLAFFLGILPIDKGGLHRLYCSQREDQKQIIVKKTRKKGLIPMAIGDTPPNHENRIDAERNESKDLVK